MRVERYKAALLSVLVIVSLLTPMFILTSTAEAQVPSIIVVRGKDTAKNINQVGDPPWLEYEEGDRPLVIVAKRVGSGWVLAAGTSSTCRNGRWNDPDPNNPGGFEDLLDVAFQWMKPGATKVLWYEGHNVYNNSSECSQLIAALELLGYSVTPDATTPITSTLLSPYDILIIPQMQEGTGGTGGDPTKLLDSEVTAIKDFVEAGNGLLIMEASDFGGHNYHKVQNKVLQGLGFDYYFQDDQVSDVTNNYGARDFQIIADVDITTEIGASYQTATGKTTVGLYSTCSLAEAGPGVSLSVLPDYQVGMPGDTLEYTITVSNPENPLAIDLTYEIMVGDTADWSPSVSPTLLSVPVGEKGTATLTVTVPPGTSLSTEDKITVLVAAIGYPEVRSSFICIAHAGKWIEPFDDVYVSDQDADANYSGENALRIGRYLEYWQWDFLKFDLSGIPAGTDITEARLYLYAYYKYAGGFDVSVHEVEDDDWTEFDITWNNKPAYGAVLDTVFVDAASYDSPKSYSWDVTSFVVSEFEGDQWASFCVLPPDDLAESTSRAFWSKERYETRTHPFLMITYPTEVVERKVSVSISPSSKSGSRGDDVTFTVTVRNQGTLGDSYSLTFADTAGWSPSISHSTLTLAAGASGTATLTVTIPSGAGDGATDTISVTATSQAVSAVSASGTCMAIAGVAVGEVEVAIDKTSKEGKPGGKVTYTVTVTNKGTSTDTFSLQTTATADWSRSISPSTLTLNAGASGTTTLTVTIPSDAAVGASTTITVTASGAGYEDSTTCTASVAEEGGLPMTLIAIVVVVVVIVVVVALMLSRKKAAPGWTG